MKKLLILAAFLFITSPAFAQVDLGTSSSATNPQRTGDATTGLFSSTTDAVSVSSGGTEMMRVNGTGIGIGTTAPATTLDVWNSSSSPASGNAAWDSNGAQLNIDSTAGNTANNGSAIAFRSPLASGSQGGIAAIAGILDATSHNDGDIVFYNRTDIAYATETMRIKYNGNVGIGTSAPATSLDMSQKTDAIALPAGTTSQRPTGVNGMLRYNSSVSTLEAYVNATWQAITTGGNFAINIMAWPYHAACDGTTNDTSVFTSAWGTGLPVFVPQTSTGCALNAAAMPSGATLMGNSNPQYSDTSGTRSFVVPASGATSIINIGSNSNLLFENIDIFGAPGCSGGSCFTTNVECIASSSTTFASSITFLNSSVRYCGNGGIGSSSSYLEALISEFTNWYGNGQKNSSGGIVNPIDSQINGGFITANYDGVVLSSGANSNVISSDTRIEFNVDFGVNCFQCTNEDIGGTYDRNSNGAIQFDEAGDSTGASGTGSGAGSTGAATGIKVHGVFTRNGSTAGTLTDADFVMLGGNVNISFADINTWHDCGDEGCALEGPNSPLYIFDFKDNTNAGIRISAGNYTGYTTAPIHYTTSAPSDLGIVGALGISPNILPYENDVNGNMLVTQVSTPAAPTITHAGTAGAATWSYNVTCLLSSSGAHTAGSSVGSTTTGNATLTTSNYNIITISPSQGCYQYAIRRTAHGTSPTTNGLIATVPAQQLVVQDTGLAGDSSTAPADNTTGTVLGAGGVRNGLDSFVASDFSQASTTTLTAITGLSTNLYAGKTYAFELWLYTTSNSAGGIKFDLNGGTATATTLIGDSMEEDGTTFGTRTAYSSPSTGLCAITAVSTATCHITGTIVVNAAGTLIPRFAQNASNATASVVKTGSTMTVRPLN